MRKMIKKIAALALAGCMVLGMSSMAFAATTTSSDDTGSITISSLSEGVTATAYKIAGAEYSETVGEFTKYVMVTGTEGCTFQIGEDGSYDEELLTEENLAELFAVVKDNDPAGSATVDFGGDSATIENLPVGSYLIVITGSTGEEAVVYAMMIGSVSYAVDETTGEWAWGDNGGIDVEGDSLWAKATTPQVTKTEKGGDLGDYGHGGTADLGDTLTYHIDIAPVPAYRGTEPEFYVTDTLGSELTLATAADGFAVTVVGGEYDGATLTYGTDYTVSIDGNEFVVDFVVGDEYTLNAYAGEGIRIEYQATVSEAGTEGADDHENDVTLTYATTSYMAGNDATDSDADHDYTFSAKLFKTGSDLDGAGLKGAEFSLYTDEDCKTAYTQNGAAVSATSGDDGYFTFSGLEAGTYYMKETKAPYGYSLIETVYTIKISCELNADGSMSTWGIAITDDEGNPVASVTGTSNTGATITDTHLGRLPAMGGRGTLIFTLAGCAVVCGAVAGVAVSRKRKVA